MNGITAESNKITIQIYGMFDIIIYAFHPADRCCFSVHLLSFAAFLIFKDLMLTVKLWFLAPIAGITEVAKH